MRTVICVLLTCLSSVGCMLNTSPGTGEKIGQIVKLSSQGIMCATWEGQLIRGGMTGGSGTIGAQPFDFTIESKEMADKAQQFMADQTEVVIKYRMEGVYSACRSDSGGHFLVSIEPAKKTAEKP